MIWQVDCYSEIGAALWPEWEDRAALLAKQTTLGERCFAALFQQTPIAAKGRLFDLSKVRIVDRIPLGISVRAWDLAGTGDACADPDWTVGLRLLQDEHGRYCRLAKGPWPGGSVSNRDHDAHACRVPRTQ